MLRQKSVAKSLTLLTGIISIIFATAVPLGYFLSSYQYLAGIVQAESEYTAERVSGIISRNPEMWEFEQIRLVQILSKDRKIMQDENVQILKTDGTLVAHLGINVIHPVIKGQAVVYDAGLPVCSIETVRSIFPLIVRSVSIGIACFALGIFIFYFVRNIAVNALISAEKALLATEERFQSVVQTAADAIVSADSNNNIISWNSAAMNMFGYTEFEVLGRPMSMLMTEPYRNVYESILNKLLTCDELSIAEKTMEIKGIKKDRFEFPADLSLSRLRTDLGVFYTAIIRDTTERSQAAAEKEKLINELKDALAHVRTLRDMLPICAYCKKIRNDAGYWEGVETYISEHTGTMFSHGMCPDCSKKAYKELEKLTRKET